jgi:anaerobic selenocysteine-containing dehydrogenase
MVDGGNPANALPQTTHAEQALAALDLLVVIEPFMTETAALADYILPPPMMLERPDIPSRDYEAHVLMAPYAQYSESVIDLPADSETIEDWRVFWELARRMGHGIAFDGVPLDMERPPTAPELIRHLLRDSAVPVDEIVAAREGRLFDVAPLLVEPGAGEGRFDLAPPDVVGELAEVRAEAPAAGAFRLAVRRVRDAQNSMFHGLPGNAARMPDNPLWIHPDDMASAGIAEGERIRIASADGAIEACAASDVTMRPGVVAMNHGWGGGRGVNVNRLTGLGGRDPINAMPVLSGFPVRLERLA